MGLPSLANAELAIMDLLWEQDNLTARQVREELYPGAEREQHGTVQKLLQRLERKGFVARDRRLPVHLFSAMVSRGEYTGGQLECLAEKLTGGSLAPLLTQLVEQKRISQKDIAELKAILDQYSEEGDQAR